MMSIRVLAMMLPSLFLTGSTGPGADDGTAGSKGKIVLFASFDNGPNRNSKQGLYVIDPATGGLTEIADVPIKNGRIALGRFRLSPDGRTIAYNELREKRTSPAIATIWLRQLRAGAEPRKISDIDGWPIWGAEGKSLIAVEAVADADPRKTDYRYLTWRIDADGSRRGRLPIPETDQICDWSSDGRWLVGVSRATTGKDFDLVVLHPDGSERHRLIEPGQNFEPRFSPNGRRVAYTASPPGQKSSILVVNLDGTGRRTIYTERNGEHVENVSWSPDGMQLVATIATWTKIESGNERGGVTPKNPRLCTIDVESGVVRVLIHPAVNLLGTPEWR